MATNRGASRIRSPICNRRLGQTNWSSAGRVIAPVLVVPLLARSIVGGSGGPPQGAGRIPDEQIDLLQTFAAQSVLAIQNARLFSEIEEKGRQLAEASQHKSQFLANMSHELRTPLNAILGYTELILDDVYGETPDKMRDVLERIQSNGRHLLGLINDVLDLSKIEAGQLTLALADYSLKDVVHGVFSAVEPLAAEKQLALQGRGAARPARGPRRRAAAHAGAAQPGRQRHQVHRPGRGGDQGRRRQRLVQSSVRDTGPASPRPTRPSCSRSSSRPTIRSRARRAAPGSGSPSPSGSSSCTAAASGWSRGRGKARRSPSRCRSRSSNRRGKHEQTHSLVVEDQEDNRQILRDLCWRAPTTS